MMEQETDGEMLLAWCMWGVRGGEGLSKKAGDMHKNPNMGSIVPQS